MEPGTYNIPGITRGDTFASRAIATATEDDAPLVMTSARMQIRTKRDKCVVYEWSTVIGNASITGTNSIVINQVLPDETEKWATGVHAYDLEVDTESHGTITLLAGDFTVRADITRD